MTDLVFFYGTLMSAFGSPGRAGLEDALQAVGRGWISATLFDLGIYPAAIPAHDARVWGEIYLMLDVEAVLTAIDEIEGFSAGEPAASLYTRAEIPVTFGDGQFVNAWAYFYNAPLGRAERIESGDYLEYLRIK